MGHIFISYSRNDGNHSADEIERFLQAKGFETWRDVRQLRPEQDFTAAIELAIESASYVLVCITPDSKRDNSFVRREVQYALITHETRKKTLEALPVIPIRCDKSTVPHISIVDNEWLPWFEDRKTAENRLLEILTGGAYVNHAPETADPLRPYVQYLYQRVVQYLKSAIITHEIPLTSETTPDAVPTRQPDMLDQFFLAKGIQSSSDDHHTFTNFTEAFNHPAFVHRVLLLGQPGAGKTITLMAYTRDAAAAWLDKPNENPLPLLGTIATWDAYQQPSFADWLGRAYSQLSPADVQRVLDAGKALLLLDGLDELGSERPVDPEKLDGEKFDPRQRFLSTIDALVEAHRDAPSHTQILVTCRPKDYDQIGAKIALKGAITLQPLDDAQIAAYLRDQPELLNAIMNDDALREVAQTPLLLSIFGFVYQGMTETERTELANLKQAGDIRDKIFNAYIDGRYKHEALKRNADLPFSLDEVRAILARLAWQNLTDYKAFANVITLYNLVHNVDLQKVEQARIEAFIELAIRLNLLVIGGKDHSSRSNYRFIHLLLRDTVAFTWAKIALHGDESLVRSHAADALGSLADPRALDPLLTALQDPDGSVRSRAAEALGAIGDPRATDALLTAFQGPDGSVRSNAAFALGKVGDPRALDALLMALRNPDRDMRYIAAISLGQLADPRALDPLLTALQDPDGSVRSRAAEALGAIGDPRATDALLAALRDPAVRYNAAKALGNLGAPALDPLLTALQDPDVHIRSRAAEALGAIGDPRATDALLAVICEDDNTISYDISRALSKLDAPTLDIFLTIHPGPEIIVRHRAAQALREIGDPRAIEGLLVALHDPHIRVRSRAAQALGAIGDPRATDALLAVLQDTDVHIRSRAAEALGAIGDPRATDALLAVLHDPDDIIRSHAAQALVKLGDPSALNLLIVAVRDIDWYVRANAVADLGALGDIRALNPLLDILRDENSDVRSKAVAALARLGDIRAIDALLDSLRDEDSMVSRDAADAIEKIGTPEALIALERWRREHPNG